ncbi:hypothetical protein AAG570_003089 [Ranatra chinensis]|uniref:Ferritin-like diiron domain-containing protein n=1 Tax=Ranatra chinensis TaxID=642074 RepID=A0ABD0Y683_9HEMI
MKLFRKLSDSTWDDAIDLIKYTTKRGGSVDLSKTTYSVVAPPPLREFRIGTVELLGLSRALDMHKHLANQAHDIHKDVSAHSQKVHDAEVMSYLEKEFVHKHADTIRNLAGYLRDVVSLSELENPNLAVFMFDEYLQKVV